MGSRVQSARLHQVYLRNLVAGKISSTLVLKVARDEVRSGACRNEIII